MEFTYNDYLKLINLLKGNGYNFCDYSDCDMFNKAVIFRHDVDLSLQKALDIAKLDNKYGVSSTFFVLISTDFYNVLSKQSNDILKEILNLGHKIGLHFDEKNYQISDVDDLEHFVECECNILENKINQEVSVVSMHRPSEWILDNNIQFKRIINSYSQKYFHEFKYLSDSRMHWREDVLGIVESGVYNKLQIVTHPFWYSSDIETMRAKILNFIKAARNERYRTLLDNIRDLDDIVKEEEINNEY